MAWGAEAPVRTLDFIIMTCVTVGTCPSLQTMWQTQKKKGFQIKSWDAGQRGLVTCSQAPVFGWD